MGETQKTNFKGKNPSLIERCAASTMRKKDGSIDHRGHSGNDRTPSQKKGSEARKKK